MSQPHQDTIRLDDWIKIDAKVITELSDDPLDVFRGSFTFPPPEGLDETCGQSE